MPVTIKDQYTASPVAELPRSFLYTTAAAADSRLWDWQVNGTTLRARILTDNEATATTWLTVVRSGTTISSVTLSTLASLAISGDLTMAATSLIKWGTTSSFPALKRSGTNLQVRLADDSGFAPIAASVVTGETALAGPGTVASAGGVRLANDSVINARNAANSADIRIAGVNSSNIIVYGVDTSPIHLYGAETTDPSAPAANSGVMYYRDNGAGKTQLVVRFNTGAVQVIATEP